MTDRRKGLRLASYNIHKGYSASNRHYVLPHIRDHLRAYDSDIVFLQEVCGQHPSKHKAPGSQADYLSKQYWPHHHYGMNAQYKLGDHGNALLSRWPLKLVGNLNISTNRWERRGLLHCIASIPHSDRELHLLCVHLNLRHRCRLIQLAQISDYVRAHIPFDAAIALAGDFNDWMRRADGQMESVGMVDAHRHLHGHHAKTFPAAFPWLSLDRIYLRGCEIRQAERHRPDSVEPLSDHAMLVAEIKLSTWDSLHASSNE